MLVKFVAHFKFQLILPSELCCVIYKHLDYSIWNSCNVLIVYKNFQYNF